ncbi:MAG: ARPP-1 family domain-containing protein, partial [Phycisphaerales bacterium]
MIATAPFRLEVLNSDHNAGTLTLVAPTEGLTFAFLGSGATAPAAAPARLFGLDPDAELAIEEVSLGGSVPTLRAHNRSAHDILIIAGQVVRGGKQNRGVNSDMLVAAGQFADVPVTCVEQGRWSGDPRSRFSHAGIEPIAVRTAKMRDVHMSRRMRNSHEADQGRVWNAIADMQSSFGVASRSNDLLASMEAVRSGNFGAAAPELFVDDRTLELRDRARRTAMEISRMSRMLASCLGAGDLNEAAEIQHALEIAQGRLRYLRVELDAAEAAA